MAKLGIIRFRINTAVLPGRDPRSPFSHWRSVAGSARDRGLDSVGGTGMDRWPRGCRWIGRNGERVGFLSVCWVGFLLLALALSALLLPRLARKVIGRLFATLSGTKWAALPVDCCYLSSDKET